MERKKSSSHRKPSSAAQQPNFTNIHEYPHKEPEFVPPSPLKSHTKPIIERAIESTTPNPQQSNFIYRRLDWLGTLEEVELPRFFFLPNSTWKKRWDFLIIIMILFSTVLTPIEISFELDEKSLNHLNNVGYALDFLYFIDIVFSFRTAIINDHGFIIADQKKVVRSYIKGWFFLDLLSALPLDLIFDSIDLDGFNSKILRVLKIPRIIRVVKLLNYFERMKYAQIMKMVRLFIVFILVAHWVGCFWVLFEDDPLVLAQPLENQYLTGLLAGTYILVLNAQVSSNSVSSIFQLAALFVGTCLNAVIFGNMVALIEDSNREYRIFEKKMDLINEKIRYINLPDGLKSDIRNYFEYIWMRHRALLVEEDLFRDLAPSLKRKLYLHQYADALNNVSILKKSSVNFINDLVLRLNPLYVLPDSFLCTEGEVGNEMFLISKGIFKVFVGGEYIAKLRTGDVFGEVSLFLRTKKRISTVIACGYCDIFSISRKDAEELEMDHSQEIGSFKALARMRFAQTADYFTDEQRIELVGAQKTNTEQIWISLAEDAKYRNEMSKNSRNPARLAFRRRADSNTSGLLGNSSVSSLFDSQNFESNGPGISAEVISNEIAAKAKEKIFDSCDRMIRDWQAQFEERLNKLK